MPSVEIKNNPRLLKWLLIFLGTLTWSVTMVKSGWLYSFGYGFWGANGHDAVWHIAIINGLSKLSFEMPLLSGYQIQNYHLGFDIFVALLHRLTSISIPQLYFQILPPLCAFFLGILVYNFVFSFSRQSTAAWWSTFFVYFGTSLGWIFGKGDSVFWAQQSLSTLINPPFAWSLIVLLIGLISLQKNRLWLSVICFGLLPEIKIYAGIVAFAGLGLSAIWEKRFRPVLIISVLITLPLFLLTNRSSGNLIIFDPGWFLQTLFAPDRLDYSKFFSALTTYKQGHILFKGFIAYSVAFVIFCLGNLGFRIISLFSLKKHSWLDKFVIGVMLSGTLFPLLFVQKGTAWNTIQFFYYVIFFASLLTGQTIVKIFLRLKTQRSKILFISILLFISIPEIYSVLKNYVPSRPPAQISLAEISALNKLASLPPGIVLEPLFDAQSAAAAANLPPRPLYLYESTAYVSAYTSKLSFLSDEVNLHITGYDISDRKRQIADFWHQPNGEFLIKNNISYLYLTPLVNQDFKLIPGITQLYNSNNFKIYSFDSNIYSHVNIFSDQAKEMVSRLPKIKAFISNSSNRFIDIDHYDPQSRSWIVHIYELNSGQVISQSWVVVDSHTGSIYDAKTLQPLSPLSPS